MNEDFTFFYGGIYSQWAMFGFFDFENKYYNCAEQFMMCQKAEMFGDYQAYNEIMATDMPNEQKAIGRRIKDFDKEEWEEDALAYVTAGNYLKFTQSEYLYQELKNSGNSVLVEASPTDVVWGVGLGEFDPLVLNPDNWRGKNWLGIAIMRVRERLFNQSPFDSKYMRP